ncbi:restriction endonuclease [Bacillus sp. APMAM]|nr:restriction endonuclease [Bacillus sp. APMAM]
MFSKEITVSSPFEPKSINLNYCIQIKKHQNLTDLTIVQQLVKMEENLNLEDSNIVQKILISLADEFTNECEILANDKKVSIINGVEFEQLYFKSV